MIQVFNHHILEKSPYLSPPILLGVLLSVLDHVLNVVFAEASWRLNHDWEPGGDEMLGQLVLQVKLRKP